MLSSDIVVEEAKEALFQVSFQEKTIWVVITFFIDALDDFMEKKAPAIQKTLQCTLEELYTGSTKKMKITKDVTG